MVTHHAICLVSLHLFFAQKSFDFTRIGRLFAEKGVFQSPRWMNHPVVGPWGANHSSVEVRRGAAHTLLIINHVAAHGKWMQNVPNKQNQVTPDW